MHDCTTTRSPSPHNLRRTAGTVHRRADADSKKGCVPMFLRDRSCAGGAVGRGEVQARRGKSCWEWGRMGVGALRRRQVSTLLARTHDTPLQGPRRSEVAPESLSSTKTKLTNLVSYVPLARATNDGCTPYRAVASLLRLLTPPGAIVFYFFFSARAFAHPLLVGVEMS